MALKPVHDSWWLHVKHATITQLHSVATYFRSTQVCTRLQAIGTMYSLAAFAHIKAIIMDY